MSRISLVCLFSVLAVVVIARPDEKYTLKYDNIDLDQILKNDRLLENYYKCLMEQGKCTPDGAELKKNLPDALNTKCAKCSETQRKGTQKVIEYVIKNKLPWWQNLEKKYDPQGNYKKQYGADLEKKGIKW